MTTPRNSAAAGVTIVMPVLGEAAGIRSALERLRSLRPAPERVIVVDGGSTDGTKEIVDALAGDGWLLSIEGPRGRGPQLNLGASLATSDNLLFLHGDAELPPDALRAVSETLGRPGVTGGAFSIAFRREPGSPRSMPIIAAGINARTRLTRSATGDQAIFCSRSAFDSVGGFADWPLFEDADLVTRLKRGGLFVILDGPVTISDRRYAANGPWRTTVLMWWLRVRYWLGHSPEDLKRSFADVR